MNISCMGRRKLSPDQRKVVVSAYLFERDVQYINEHYPNDISWYLREVVHRRVKEDQIMLANQLLEMAGSQ